MGAKLFSLSAFFIFTAYISYHSTLENKTGDSQAFFKKAHLEICELVFKNYYDRSTELQKWYDECLQSTAAFSKSKAMTEFHQREQNLLNRLQTSHLEFFDPESNRLLWLSESLDTGVRARFIDKKYVVYELVENGPGFEAGLKLGDVISKINGKEVENFWDVRSIAGDFEIVRKNETFTVEVEARSIQIDDDPRVYSVDDNTGLVRIPSFIYFHFEDEILESLLDQALQFDRLIVDLRGNSGGDFVAMLKVLSPFYCKPTSVGVLLQPQFLEKLGASAGAFDPNFGAAEQIESLTKFSKINLVTFKTDRCFDGPVTVLTDEQTASVSEIFAEGIRRRPLTRVWGQYSSGSVVLAVWHPLSIGKGYSLSVPQAIYESPQGIRLEGRGVWPDKILKYDLALSLLGTDSWIEEVSKKR